jgi:hypothetical protein
MGGACCMTVRAGEHEASGQMRRPAWKVRPSSINGRHSHAARARWGAVWIPCTLRVEHDGLRAVGAGERHARAAHNEDCIGRWSACGRIRGRLYRRWSACGCIRGSVPTGCGGVGCLGKAGTWHEQRTGEPCGGHHDEHERAPHEGSRPCRCGRGSHPSLGIGQLPVELQREARGERLAVLPSGVQGSEGRVAVGGRRGDGEPEGVTPTSAWHWKASTSMPQMDVSTLIVGTSVHVEPAELTPALPQNSRLRPA